MINSSLANRSPSRSRPEPDSSAVNGTDDPVSRHNVIRIAASDAPTSCIDDVAEGIARALSGRLSTTGVASYAMST